MAKKDDNIVMTFVEKVFTKTIEDSSLNDIAKKTMRLRLYKDVASFGTALEASFKVLADELVSDKQTCNKCGNEIYFKRYATYPKAKLKLPKNFGKPVMYEHVFQYDPNEVIDD